MGWDLARSSLDKDLTSKRFQSLPKSGVDWGYIEAEIKGLPTCPELPAGGVTTRCVSQWQYGFCWHGLKDLKVNGIHCFLGAERTRLFQRCIDK